eukprot:TRINITY_DN2107_c0_g1_i1.p1 TRINITY_DN2107_c0_g1~~TRINITY_DN2107_c0_g1_i1.p1  ORF type:complete len:319 (+),score=41.84 TRINITY_DN2107_c0_g1_i1:58-957(+)
MASAMCVNLIAAATVSFSASSPAGTAASSSDCVPLKALKVSAVLSRKRGPVPISGHVRRLELRANAGEVSTADAGTEAQNSTDESDDRQWIPVIPVSALPRGERRLIRQDGVTILLLWYKNDVFAIENTSPAEGAYSEGFVNAKLTQDGCVVCPSTETTFDLKTGAIKDWYPTNAVLRFLTRPVRDLETYPVKSDSDYIYIDMKKGISGQSAEIIFGEATQVGKTATNVDVEEIRMVEVNEREAGGFGFSPDNEITNGRAAMMGFSALLLIELVTGKGILKGTGFLDFLYKYLPGFPVL